MMAFSAQRECDFGINRVSLTSKLDVLTARVVSDS